MKQIQTAKVVNSSNSNQIYSQKTHNYNHISKTNYLANIPSPRQQEKRRNPRFQSIELEKSNEHNKNNNGGWQSRVKSLHANTLQKMISALGGGDSGPQNNNSALPNLAASMRQQSTGTGQDISEMGPYMYGRKLPMQPQPLLLLQGAQKYGSASPAYQENPIDQDSIISNNQGFGGPYQERARCRVSGEQILELASNQQVDNNTVLSSDFQTLNIDNTSTSGQALNGGVRNFDESNGLYANLSETASPKFAVLAADIQNQEIRKQSPKKRATETGKAKTIKAHQTTINKQLVRNGDGHVVINRFSTSRTTSYRKNAGDIQQMRNSTTTSLEKLHQLAKEQLLNKRTTQNTSQRKVAVGTAAKQTRKSPVMVQLPSSKHKFKTTQHPVKADSQTYSIQDSLKQNNTTGNNAMTASLRLRQKKNFIVENNAAIRNSSSDQGKAMSLEAYQKRSKMGGKRNESSNSSQHYPPNTSSTLFKKAQFLKQALKNNSKTKSLNNKKQANIALPVKKHQDEGQLQKSKEEYSDYCGKIRQASYTQYEQSSQRHSNYSHQMSTGGVRKRRGNPYVNINSESQVSLATRSVADSSNIVNSTASMLNLSYSHKPMMPDLYQPYEKFEPLPQEDFNQITTKSNLKFLIAKRKAQRIERRQLRRQSNKNSLMLRQQQEINHKDVAMVTRSYDPDATDTSIALKIPNKPQNSESPSTTTIKVAQQYSCISGSAAQTRLLVKRQLTDKYSAEKINKSKKRDGSGSLLDSNEKEKTRLSFPSDFSQVAKAKQHGNFPKRSGTQRENEKENNLRGRQNQHQLSGAKVRGKSPLSSAYGRKKSPIKSISNDSFMKRGPRLRAFQNAPNKGQMKHHRPWAYGPSNMQRNSSSLVKQQRGKAEAEAIRLIQNKNDMFERYLKKPSTTSVGFLVLDRMHSNSTSRPRNTYQQPQQVQAPGPARYHSNVRGQVVQNSMSKKQRYEQISAGGGIVSDNGKSPNRMLSSQDGGESFTVSNLQTTYEIGKQGKFDSLSIDQASFTDGINSTVKIAANKNDNYILSASMSLEKNQQKEAEILNENYSNNNSIGVRQIMNYESAEKPRTKNREALASGATGIFTSANFHQRRSTKGSSQQAQQKGQKAASITNKSPLAKRIKAIKNQITADHQAKAALIQVSTNSVVQQKAVQSANGLREGAPRKVKKSQDRSLIISKEQQQKQLTQQMLMNQRLQKKEEESGKIQDSKQLVKLAKIRAQSPNADFEGCMDPVSDKNDSFMHIGTCEMGSPRCGIPSEDDIQHKVTSQFGGIVAESVQNQLQGESRPLNATETDVENQIGLKHQQHLLDSYLLEDQKSDQLTVERIHPTGASLDGEITFGADIRPQTSKIHQSKKAVVDSQKRAVRNQTFGGRQAKNKKQQPHLKGFLTQAKIDKRRSMQKGSRFAYALDYMHDKQSNLASLDLTPHEYASENKLRKNFMLTPAGNSLTMTGPSTHYNQDSKMMQHVMRDGLTCFGNPTLETLKIKGKLPSLDLQIQQVIKKGSIVNQVNVTKSLVKQQPSNNNNKNNQQYNSQYSRQIISSKISQEYDHSGNKQMRNMNFKTLPSRHNDQKNKKQQTFQDWNL